MNAADRHAEAVIVFMREHADATIAAAQTIAAKAAEAKAQAAARRMSLELGGVLAPHADARAVLEYDEAIAALREARELREALDTMADELFLTIVGLLEEKTGADKKDAELS